MSSIELSARREQTRLHKDCLTRRLPVRLHWSVGYAQIRRIPTRVGDAAGRRWHAALRPAGLCPHHTVCARFFTRERRGANRNNVIHWSFIHRYFPIFPDFLQVHLAVGQILDVSGLGRTIFRALDDANLALDCHGPVPTAARTQTACCHDSC
ncbi:uncharacterized protein SPSK_01288 [Sporothrix schenckii 1099-18]|uniref:Uncharacterized protein n=1 Tax=Sporothrix schenckii 1099-18 TaxID=1397361 RepID=A0A0F2LVA7_SPOSC|nr:uncharacterized protein SPSK_01288 [Sporothrix schenckii 1099-18]KJR81393.1 hypothetical protein SPSK_01288 [Sporothrix schenckii 1099-18]